MKRIHKQRQVITKIFFKFPTPPMTGYSKKRITYVEIMVTSDTVQVDVDCLAGGIRRNSMTLEVTAYNAQMLNAKATVYGIRTKK